MCILQIDKLELKNNLLNGKWKTLDFGLLTSAFAFDNNPQSHAIGL